ncbi:MAG: acetolactate synthase small subunit [Cyclobacteriaceae bacterium]
MEAAKEYTLSVLTEDKPGLLNRLTIIFSRRKINIGSLNVSSTEVKGVSRYTLVATETKEQLDKVVRQIRKLVDVLGAFVYEEDEITYREIALYKISAELLEKNGEIEELIRNSGVKVVETDKNHLFLEKTGTKEETHKLYLELEPYGILEFVRSGRVAISKSTRKTEAFIKELENSRSNKRSIKDF